MPIGWLKPNLTPLLVLDREADVSGIMMASRFRFIEEMAACTLFLPPHTESYTEENRLF
jgi:hypothetical protein